MKFARLVRPLAIAAIAAGLLIASHSTALADDQRDFDISNESSQSMVGVWISPSASTEWGPMVNPSEVPSYAVLHVTFPYAAPGMCTYDIHVSYADGRPDQLEGIDICNVLTIHVTDTQILLENVQ